MPRRASSARLSAVTVVTIARNCVTEIGPTMDSVFAQTHPRLDYVVVDGASTDGTPAAVRRAMRRHPGRVRLLSEPDDGISDAFNKGLRLARGEAVLFLNAGDRLVDPDYLARAAGLLAAHPEAAFVHASILFDDAVAGWIETPPSLSRLGRGMPYRHQTMLVRRSAFETVGGFDTGYRVTMDFEHVCRMRLAGLEGWYDRTGPVVAMDGRGVSVSREWLGIREGRRALRIHGLFTWAERLAYLRRTGGWAVRRALLAAGLGRLLAALKRRKYRAGGVP